MAKAPAIIKWFFAIIAFFAGSVVAQLLQPPTIKTEGIGGVTLLAQLDASPSELSVGTNDQTVITLTAKPTAELVHTMPLGNAPVETLRTHAPEGAPITRPALPRVKTSLENSRVKPSVSESNALAVTASDEKKLSEPRARASEPTDIANDAARVTPLTEKRTQNSILRTAIGNRSISPQPDPQPALTETLSLTSLPALSSEASDFHSIRHSLTGQFEPLKGVPQSEQIPPAKKAVVARQSPAAFSTSTALPTEILPVAKLKPPADDAGDEVIVVPPESQHARTHPVVVQKSVDKSSKASGSGKSVATGRAIPATRHATAKSTRQKTTGPKQPQARITAARNTESPITDKVESPADKETSIPLSPELVALRTKLARVIKMYREQEISVREKSAWSVMHSFIGYGVEKKVRIDHQGNRASAIGWICFNNPCRGVRLFYLKNGEIYGRLGPGNQGHEGQFLAMLAQSRVHADYPMKIEGRDFTVLDLVEREKRSCRPKTELTFKLIGLSHYLESDETWRDDRGGEWNIPRLLREEMQQPIIGAACGGTHRLFGLSYAINRRVHKGKPLDGQYRRAEVYINDYQRYTFKMQNPDGSFSTRFFSGRGAENDLDRRLLTTGHVAEWLAFSLKKEELTGARMVHAMDYLAGLLLRGKYPGWKVGPLGHALHAVNIYNDRVFKQTASTPIVATRSR